MTAAEGGVAIEPWSDDAAAEIGRLLGLPFELEPFRAWAAGDPCSTGILAAAPGLPADAQPAAVRGARRRDHDAADLACAAAARSGATSSRATACSTSTRGSSRRASRSRSSARATSSRSGSRARRPSTSSSSPTPTSTSRRSRAPRRGRDRAQLTSVRGASGAGLPTGSSPGTSHARARGPQATSACERRSRRSTLPTALSRSRRSRSMGERFAPFENLSAQFLLAGARMAG